MKIHSFNQLQVRALDVVSFFADDLEHTSYKLQVTSYKLSQDYN